MHQDILESAYDGTVTEALTLSVNTFFIGKIGLALNVSIDFFPYSNGNGLFQPKIGLGYIYSNNIFYFGGILGYCYEPSMRHAINDSGFKIGVSFLTPTILGGYNFGPLYLVGQLSYMLGMESLKSGINGSLGVGVRVGK